MLHASDTDAAKCRFRVEGHGAAAWIHPYFGTEPGPAGHQRMPGDPGPMAYLVEQDPETSITPHFHQVEQFQIVVGGKGRIGRHAVEPLSVHYTSAHTGYGPLTASSAGLSYLTLRNRWDPGLRPLPQARHELLAAANRRPVHRLAAGLPEPDLVDVGLASTVSVQPVLEANGPGSGRAWQVHAPPEASVELPGDAQSDQFWIVRRGGLQMQGMSHRSMSCLFLPGRGMHHPVQATSVGLVLLVLEFAHDSNDPGTASPLSHGKESTPT